MSTEITRKDRLAANIRKLQLTHGADLDLIPETYVLPEQLQDFKEAFLYHQMRNGGLPLAQQTPNIWIVKPSAMSQGKGIFISNNLNDICQSAASGASLVVSRYIANPMLINGLKFDLRIYVLVTSFDPCIRAYVYHEGLVRFATEPFSLHDLGQ